MNNAAAALFLMVGMVLWIWIAQDAFGTKKRWLGSFATVVAAFLAFGSFVNLYIWFTS